MKTLTFDHISNIDPKLISQIQKDCPRSGLQQDLGNSDTKDSRVQFANTQIACILHEDDKLLSFCSIGQDELFNRAIAQAIDLDPSECMTLLYLFTTPSYKQQGNAQLLGGGVTQYIQEKYPHIKYLIGTTGSEYAKNIYEQYGSQEVGPKMSSTIEELQIDSQHFFKHCIR